MTKTCTILKFFCFTSFFLIFYLLQSECNVLGEWEFQEIHPDLDHLHWKQLDYMSREQRLHLCEDVIANEMPPTEPKYEFLKDHDPSESMMLAAPVVTGAQVRFEHRIVFMSLIKCEDKRYTFYLADGGENRVFSLQCNDKDGTYSFTSGLQNVTYPR